MHTEEDLDANASMKSTSRPSSFQFVTFNTISGMRGANAKSLIRKHAMKDIGASRRRSGKQRKGYIRFPLDWLDPADQVRVPDPMALSVPSGAIDPFLDFPVELDHTGRELVANSTSSSPSLPCAEIFPSSY